MMFPYGALDPRYVQAVEQQYDLCKCGCNYELTATGECPWL